MEDLIKNDEARVKKQLLQTVSKGDQQYSKG